MFSELELSSQSPNFIHFYSFFKAVIESNLLWEAIYNSFKKSDVLYPMLPNILNSSILAMMGHTCYWLTSGVPQVGGLHSEKGAEKGGILSFLLA